MKHFGRTISFLTGIAMLLLGICGANRIESYAAAPYADDGDDVPFDELWLELMKEADAMGYTIEEETEMEPDDEYDLEDLYMLDESEITDGEYHCGELLILKQLYWDETETVEENICYYLAAFENYYSDLYYCVIPFEVGSMPQASFEGNVENGVLDWMIVEGDFYLMNDETSILWMNYDTIIDEHLKEILWQQYDSINQMYVTSWYLYGQEDLSVLEYGYLDEDMDDQWDDDNYQWDDDDDWTDDYIWENEYEEPVTDYLWGATLLIGGCIGVTWVRQKNRDRKKQEAKRKSVSSKPPVSPSKKQPVQPKPQTTAQPNTARPKQTNQALTEEWNGRIYRTAAFYENEDAQRAAAEEAKQAEARQQKAAEAHKKSEANTESKLERYRREQKERAEQEDSLLDFLEGYNAYSDFTFSVDAKEEE